MRQSKKMSLYETMFNQITGFVASILVYLYVIPPIFGITTTVQESTGVVAVFTVMSILRSYYTRRLFVWIQHQGISWLQ